MNILSLETEITYGPLFSRRLGRSLGVNLLPFDRKVCSFDCVYCHYGHTAVHTLAPDSDLEIVATFPAVHEVLQAVEAALRRYPHVDALTFSGNGEPTLHPHFPAIVAGTRRLRDAIAGRDAGRDPRGTESDAQPDRAERAGISRGGNKN